MAKRKKIFKRGVTMMELLIVMALLAILALGSMVGWRLQLAKARDAQRKSDLQNFKIGLSSYYEDKGCFPQEAEISCGSTFLAPYLPVIPCDPINNTTYKYEYERGGCSAFRVFARLENENDEVIETVGCVDGCESATQYNYYVSSGEFVEQGGEDTITPTCGGVTKYCYANVCSSCCPGASYRCSSDGDACIFDPSCQQ